MPVNFVLYFLYFILHILYLMKTCHTWIYFFLHLLYVNKSTYRLKKIVDCWKETTARKTHVKQLHFYPIISYQIQTLSIQEHNVLAFLKKYLIKTFLTWNRRDVWLSLLWYSPLKVGPTRLGCLIFLLFIEQQ